VSVSYVADAIVSLALSDERPDGTFNLTAGDTTGTVGDLIDIRARRIGRKPPVTLPPALHRRVVHPLMMFAARGKRKRRLRSQAVFYPYFATRARFDTTRARQVLEADGIRPRELNGYFDRLIDFAEDSQWGRTEITRPESHRAQPDRVIRHEPRPDSRPAVAVR
jgi:hypothetical protein